MKTNNNITEFMTHNYEKEYHDYFRDFEKYCLNHKFYITNTMTQWFQD